MLERLIENWLTSASERTYQRCFCQMLIGRGYRIIHNTEHTPLEHGKDVVAISPEGRVTGFQLKGNPGRSLKPGEFGEIRGQIEQLATLALGLPGYEKVVPEECYLVTNGEIDEAVSIEIQRLNAALEARGHPPEKIKTITRGTLLAWANSLGLALWPSEMEDFGNIVKLLNCNGDEMFPAKNFDPLLQHTLRMQHDVPVLELRRRITSAAVMTAVTLHSFSHKRNHYAELTAWVMFITYSIAACEKNNVDPSKDKVAAESMRTARVAIYELLRLLCEELKDRASLAEGDPFSEFAFYHPRALLIYALMGIYWIWSETEGWGQPDHKAVIENLMPENLPPSIWGEGAIPNFLTYIWFRKRIAPSPAQDALIAIALHQIMKNKLAENVEHLASPYYTIEDVKRHEYLQILGCPDPFGGGGFAGTSYVCESLMMCLVRAGLKQACRELWPDFTRVNHERSTPDDAWRFALYRFGEHGVDDTNIYRSTMRWADLELIMAEDEGPDIPKQLKDDPLLLLLFVNVFPFRGSFSATKFLHRKFDPNSKRRL